MWQLNDETTVEVSGGWVFLEIFRATTSGDKAEVETEVVATTVDDLLAIVGQLVQAGETGSAQVIHRKEEGR